MKLLTKKKLYKTSYVLLEELFKKLGVLPEDAIIVATGDYPIERSLGLVVDSENHTEYALLELSEYEETVLEELSIEELEEKLTEMIAAARKPIMPPNEIVREDHQPKN